MSFSHLGLSPKVLSAVTAAGFETPTPIQNQAIPHAVAGRDVLGIAQTGTGKTASFVLPMLTRLERGRARARMPRSLILEPTRELAAQVAEHFETLGKNHKLTVALLIGGVSYEDQDRKLDRGADVVIATPGRLLDHFERGKLLLNGIEIHVVDEADRMLDMGFIPDIERICKLLPFTRQTLFFSATMPPEIQRLADKFLHNPARVEVAPQATAAATIVQRLKRAPDDPAAKREALRALMREIDVKNAIIFCNRKKDVGILFRSLQRHGFSVGALHGDMDQRQRMATLDAFRNGQIAFLAASDVAARGLDIPDVSHIFNYDVPIHPEDYVHRIGRTGRAGREGYAAMLVTPRDMKALKAIEKLLRQDIEWIDGPQTEAEDAEGFDARSNGRHRRGRRGNRNKGGQAPQDGHGNVQRHDTQAQDKGEERRTEHSGRREKSGDPKRDQHKPHHHGDRKPTHGPQAAASSERPAPARATAKPQPQPPRPKQQGMGDHVPAFMMRPVRVT
ncbi:DEAD/DEAH box helicase [Methyloceanibacter sp.]|uniref:DEAD/DEAH box helicase n=1 Tax=Methyloceanibacter sp. TaxID=1965321 RepID=UPI002D6BBA8D|nr:DEAD/DEAH box helicase [Methyloceanibacter sp.]HZP10106.1 DEAD/DEAH box helicase [Methyloceanibacter sp.]